ncbi:glucose-6-phosphate isomerase [Clostridium sp. Mt-5]|uniref:Glucose-6-phosphate isomerase n=1 Tax=Clostridium moutaii TaxID=3240932 RepID=A0ABV4BNC8_9CLOT
MLNEGIKLDLSKAFPYIQEKEIISLQPSISIAHNMIENKNGPGNDFLGWVDLPVNYDKSEFNRIKIAAQKIKKDSDALIVIGIGGSYLGARAAIEMLSHSFDNSLLENKKKKLAVFYAGNNMSSTYMYDLLHAVEGMNLSVNVVSKSGTTTEPAVAFRIFKKLLEKKYGTKEAKDRIYVTTDEKKGALRKMADREGYETFTIPDDIGGRYSVLTAVGLLPIAAAGIDIDEMMSGAGDARKAYKVENLKKNPAYQYAAVRSILYKKKKTTEMIVNFEPCLHYFGEWWKQLFGESQGKDNKGIFPASVDFSTDLHSMGQYIQQGLRIMFETFINVEKPRKEMFIEKEDEDLDGLNFLDGKSMDFVNHQAFKGTVLAHNDGNVPVIILNVPELTAYYFGYMVYFFEKSCGISGYLMGLNPFNQPGVEAYKKNMFALLGKPGYEDKRMELEKRLNS